MRNSLALQALFILLMGCGGDDDSSTTDAGGDVVDADPSRPDAPAAIDSAPPADACTGAPDLDPQPDDGTATNIVISELSVDGDYVEIFNSGTTDVDLSGLGGYQWCTLASYASVSSDPVIVPAKGYATIEFPISASNQELVLYNSSSYTDPSSILDYLCWGDGGSSRKDVADGTDPDQTEFIKWSGGCAPDIPTGGALRRKQSTSGMSATDYETLQTPDPTNCGP